jgi:hypothetical protein
MAPPVPNIEPVQATAGSTWRWKWASATYPVSEGWTLSYSLNGVSRLTWSAGWVAADGATITIPATSTAVIKAGRYELTRVWTGSGTYSGQVFTEPLDALTVTANPATVAAGVAVSFAETNLAAVKAAITARLAGDQPVEYSIGGRSVVKMSLLELQQVRVSLEAELRRINGQRRTIAIRFTQPTP